MCVITLGCILYCHFRESCQGPLRMIAILICSNECPQGITLGSISYCYCCESRQGPLHVIAVLISRLSGWAAFALAHFSENAKVPHNCSNNGSGGSGSSWPLTQAVMTAVKVITLGRIPHSLITVKATRLSLFEYSSHM